MFHGCRAHRATVVYDTTQNGNLCICDGLFTMHLLMFYIIYSEFMCGIVLLWPFNPTNQSEAWQCSKTPTGLLISWESNNDICNTGSFKVKLLASKSFGIGQILQQKNLIVCKISRKDIKLAKDVGTLWKLELGWFAQVAWFTFICSDHS